MSNAKICAVVINTINDFVHHYQSCPWQYLIERDIQSDLFSRLRSQVGKPLHPMPKPKPEIEQKWEDKKIIVNSVVSEYNPRDLPEHRSKRVDIVCLDPEKCNNPLVPWNGNPNHTNWVYSLPALIGIELKHFWAGTNRGYQDLIKDMDKMRMLKIEKRIAIGFVHTASFFDNSWKLIKKQHKEKARLIGEITKEGAIYLVSPSVGLESVIELDV